MGGGARGPVTGYGSRFGRGERLVDVAGSVGLPTGMEVELADHLGYEPMRRRARAPGIRGTGSTRKRHDKGERGTTSLCSPGAKSRTKPKSTRYSHRVPIPAAATRSLGLHQLKLI